MMIDDFDDDYDTGDGSDDRDGDYDSNHYDWNQGDDGAGIMIRVVTIRA